MSLRLLATGALLLLPQVTAAQGYRIRLDSRVQSAAYRGVTPDSISRTLAIPGTNGGFLTPDGIAATCVIDFCQFFRPGPTRRGGPWVTRVDVMAWGFGVPGLTIHANVRYASDLGSDDRWPAAKPALQLYEGYAQLARGSWQVRAGRQAITGRLGLVDIDGGQLQYRARDLDVDATVYGGWGLARGAALPVTSPVLNPLDDFQPRDRQLVAGAEIGWRPAFGDVRAEYRREVDPATDFFVSERAAVTATVRPLQQLRIFGGGEYDLAMGFVGSAEANAAWSNRHITAAAGIRRYRPFFDLWTIWGAFSPVPYHAYTSSLTLRPGYNLTLSARGERYTYDNTEAETALVRGEDEGWRWNARAAWISPEGIEITGGVNAEKGPGAASRGFDGRIVRRFSESLMIGVEGGRVERPLEFRFDEATVNWVGADAEARLHDRWHFSIRVARYSEERDRPDAAAFDWNQFRLNAGLSLQLRSASDRVWLPPRLGSGPRGGQP